jgi:hypothetical protein
VGEVSAAFAALDTYVRRDLVDAHHSRRFTPSDSIAHLRAYWSRYWQRLHLDVSAAAKDSSTLARDFTGVA